MLIYLIKPRCMQGMPREAVQTIYEIERPASDSRGIRGVLNGGYIGLASDN